MSKRVAPEPAHRFLFELPYGPEEVDGESWLSGRGRMELRVPLQRDGLGVDAVLSFDWVRAYKYMVEPLCLPFQSQAYNKLVEVENSIWISELIRDRRERNVAHLDLSHFLIYIAEEGCYEFAAETWQYQEQSHGH
ncbi:hypothetical protein IT072_07735 [Leifsonia sp. ZF2019]|uniref:hypothetical protein n=1 Tax=Leifsonia sp. ZF2019 TaxID=2781978 RepID=UPI001CC01693|nr:hypothetical protein [Leifsonia sp. ZF2019]UAJ80886.1 hypothetical protein IT072_07735 [Leifsonia sp. ZF2019]